MTGFLWKIISHEQIINFLEKSLLNQKLSHAYLFYGPRGVGKYYLANRFAQILQCQKGENNPKNPVSSPYQGEELKAGSGKSKMIPCESCPNCQQIKRGIHPDIYFIKKEPDKKNILIEQIRELQKKLSLSSFTNSYKIALIDQAQTLSEKAWDSLLKTLEEPPPKTIIILITSQIHRLPETISSRSQVLRFNLIPTQKIAKYLKQELKIEQIQAQTLAQLSFGRLGQAIKFIENPQNFINYKKAAKNLLNLLQSKPFEKLKFIENENIKKNSFLENIEIYQNLLQIWELVTRDLILLKLNQENLVNTFARSDLEKLQNSFSLNQLKNGLKSIEKTKQYLSANGSPKLAMENFLIQI